MSRDLVLIVEDEYKIADLLIDYLRQAGFDTHWIARGDEVMAWLRNNKAALMLLDIMLPGKDGLSVCREIRAFTDLPIVIVSARVEEIDRLLGLDLGADDYICKPFSGREVVARVKAIMRRVGASLTEKQENYRGLRIDAEKLEVSIDGHIVELTPVEFRIVALLGLSPGSIFSRKELIQKMYLDGRVVSDRTVDSHIKNLRKKMTAATADEGWIRSIYGVGYRID